jgi:hypothetical protein
VQGLDRYGYVNNNPLVYTDPSGHVADYCASIPSESGRAACVGGTMTVEEKLQQYNVTLDGEMEGWTYEHKYAVWAAVSAVGQAFARTRGQGETAAEAFRAVYGEVTFEWCDSCVSGYGWAAGDHLVRFDGMYSNTVIATRLVVHELGHLFDRAVCAQNQGGACRYIWGKGTARSDLTGKTGICDGPYCLGRKGFTGPKEGQYWGFAGGWGEWQFGHNGEDGYGENGELWADMFVGWTYDRWENTPRGEYRRAYMNARMEYYLTTNFFWSVRGEIWCSGSGMFCWRGSWG